MGIGIRIGHIYCGSKNKMSLVVEEQDSDKNPDACLLPSLLLSLKHLKVLAFTHEIPD